MGTYGVVEVVESECLRKAFSALPNPPARLWWRRDKGWEEGLFEQATTVVGSRRMTEYGRRVIEMLVPQLVGQGDTVISGLMYGVDQVAHRVCMECAGYTVAVLGWGINWRRQSEEEMRLIDEIVEHGGMVLSEWENMRPSYWTFAYRDRIMAALAERIYVVEAGLKSGTMITADWGLKLKKQIWAVPGPVTSKVSEGTNKLIADGLARIWLPHQQMKIDIGYINNAKRYTNNAEIYSLLENEVLTVDEIARKLKRPVEEMGAALSMMVLAGEVQEKEGKYYLIS